MEYNCRKEGGTVTLTLNTVQYFDSVHPVLKYTTDITILLNWSRYPLVSGRVIVRFLQQTPLLLSSANIFIATNTMVLCYTIRLKETQKLRVREGRGKKVVQ